MIHMIDDIESFWEGRPTKNGSTGQPVVTGQDLLEDWRDVRKLPKFFYFVYEGYGLETMAIVRLRCEGHIKHDKLGPSWIGVKDSIIWAGVHHKPRLTEEGKRFRYLKRNCDLTLEDTIRRFNERVHKYLLANESVVAYWEESIAQLQRQIKEYKAVNEAFRTFDIASKLKP